MLGYLGRHAIGLLALFVAIGGTAYAAKKLTGNDFRPDSITGKQVRESTLKVTRIAARPAGDQDIVADPPPGPPTDPDSAGEPYRLNPGAVNLRSRGVVEVHGDLRAELVEGCTNGFVQAFVFVDGELTTQGNLVLPLPPPSGVPIPVFVNTAPQALGKGRHRVDLRVASSCSNPSGGPGAEVTSVDLTLVAHQ
jgi:hypothetical protein